MAGHCTICRIPGRPCSACDGSGFRKPSRRVDAKAARLALQEAESGYLDRQAAEERQAIRAAQDAGDRQRAERLAAFYD